MYSIIEVNDDCKEFEEVGKVHSKDLTGSEVYEQLQACIFNEPSKKLKVVYSSSKEAQTFKIMYRAREIPAICRQVFKEEELEYILFRIGLLDDISDVVVHAI